MRSRRLVPARPFVRPCTLVLLAAAALAGERGLAQELVVNGTFDDGTLRGWSASGRVYVTNWPDGDPRRVSLVLGYDDDARQTVSQDVTLPAGSGATLRYSVYVFTEETTHPWDELEVALVDPETGAALRSVETLTDGSPAGGWLDRVVDVSSLAGRPVRLSLRARTDESTRTWFVVDDVSLVAEPSGPRLEGLVLTDAADQVTTRFRPGDVMRAYAELVDVSREESLSLGYRFLADGEDLGGGTTSVSVSPASPRGRIEFPLRADSTPGQYVLRLSLTRTAGTDTVEAPFSIATGSLDGLSVARVATADDRDVGKTDFGAGEALHLSLTLDVRTTQTVTMAFEVFDGAGALQEGLSWKGPITVGPDKPTWVLRASLAGSQPAGTYRFRGSVTAAGQTSSKETTFRVTGGTAAAATCDRAKAFVTDAQNVERAAYEPGQALRLHACVLTAATVPVDARVRWLVDDPRGVASPALSASGAVRAVSGRPDWYVSRTVAPGLGAGTYTLRTVVTVAGSTTTQSASFRLGSAAATLAPAPEAFAAGLPPVEPREPRPRAPETNR